jgi:hypothetical protein
VSRLWNILILIELVMVCGLQVPATAVDDAVMAGGEVDAFAAHDSVGGR